MGKYFVQILLTFMILVQFDLSTIAQVSSNSPRSFSHALDDLGLRGTATIDSFSPRGIPENVSLVIENLSDELEYELLVSSIEKASFVVYILDELGRMVFQTRIPRIESQEPNHYVSYNLLPETELNLSFKISNLIDTNILEFEEGAEVKYIFQLYTPIQRKNDGVWVGITVFEFETGSFPVNVNN